MEYKYFSVISYIFKEWQWRRQFWHNEKIKTMTDYDELKKIILKKNADAWDNKDDIIITNIITFINK